MSQVHLPATNFDNQLIHKALQCSRARTMSVRAAVRAESSGVVVPSGVEGSQCRLPCEAAPGAFQLPHPFRSRRMTPTQAPPRSPGALLRGALPWLQGFGRPIAKVVALALLLSTVSASAPLAVMHLVDSLGKVVAAQATGPGPIAPATVRLVLVALALVALAELVQVWLSRLLEARSWRVRLDLDFGLRQRVTARLH